MVANLRDRSAPRHESACPKHKCDRVWRRRRLQVKLPRTCSSRWYAFDVQRDRSAQSTTHGVESIRATKPLYLGTVLDIGLQSRNTIIDQHSKTILVRLCDLPLSDYNTERGSHCSHSYSYSFKRPSFNVHREPLYSIKSKARKPTCTHPGTPNRQLYSPGRTRTGRVRFHSRTVCTPLRRRPTNYVYV
ncbi:hypothetical protein BC629DRAFT_925603 [Irpex lacteus]|nr:hypothetical protein BC629DRAFT_925603 [Irpex lacteus]